MASPLLHAVDPAFLPAALEARRAALLNHLARSERLVSVCPASRLEVRPKPETLSSGIAELDAITGGIPRGCIAEIYGTPSSGKSSVLLAALARATRYGESCVLIDASDSFDPRSADAAGVDFNRLLWVRCRATPPRRRTPGKNPPSSSEYRLEQVLKSADLILQSGGFGLVALDLAGIPEKFVRRIPLASWFRFQRAVEHTRTALLVISEVPCAQTCAAQVVKVERKASAFSLQRSAAPAHSELLNDMEINAELVRSRLDHKPVQSVTASFTTQAVRTG